MTAPARLLDWMTQTTQLFEAALRRLTDADLDAATGLPGWTRRHVVAHVHGNALALRRLVHWARTGERTPMYASREQRDVEIGEGAILPPRTLRRLVRESASGLAADLNALDHRAWSAEVTTIRGRTLPASQIPWLRTRELAVHTVDLAAGIDFTDLPDELLLALADDVLRTRLPSGETAAAVRWLTGRSPSPPQLTPWL